MRVSISLRSTLPELAKPPPTYPDRPNSDERHARGKLDVSIPNELRKKETPRGTFP